MSGPQDSDVCARCGEEWWEHELLDSKDSPEQRRCPPARFRPLELEPEPTPASVLVQQIIEYDRKRARGLEVMRDALLSWERYVDKQLAMDGRPKGQMEELVRQDREALNELLRRLL